MSTLVADIGEFGLIQRIQRIVQPSAESTPRSSRLQLRIGDDAAVWSVQDGTREVITTDALVESVHFDLATTGWADLGWKSLAVNVSDVVAMGAQPDLAVISLGLPRTSLVDDVETFYRGMMECASLAQLEVVGGDIVSAPVLVINVTVVGSTSGSLLTRASARVGDLLAVTGWLGRSGGGLRLLAQGRNTASSDDLVQAHLRPMPRLLESACLVQAGVVCAMDVSDGLRGDVGHICEQSGLSAVIEVERVPLSENLIAEFGAADSLRLALDGGEDYELLCAAPRDVLERAAIRIAESGGQRLTIIGRIEERSPERSLVSTVDMHGREVAIDSLSWDHFRS